MHDLVIRNATIYDGTGAEPTQGQVAVRERRIAEVGPDVGTGRETVDAQGLALAPGIIDSHTHYDAQITWDPQATPSLGLGVTTVVMGNCGFTIAPCRPEDRERTLRNLTQVEGMSLDALLEGTRWDFQTTGEYLEMLGRRGVVPNVAVYAGHSAIRTWVMGEAATERAASDDELAQMKTVLAEALRAGAVGFATSTFEGHNGAGGVPMPSRFADERELRTLVNTLGEERRGLFMLTKGRQTTVPFLESLAVESGRAVMIAALQYDHANPTRVFSDVGQIGEARGRGRPVWGQVGCTPITFDFTLRGAYTFEALEAWRPAIPLYGDPEALVRLYNDPGFRAKVKDELVAGGSYNRFTDQWHLLEVVEVQRPEHRRYELQNVADLAAAEGKHPLDWLLDFAIADGLETLFTAQILNSDEDQVARLLNDPGTSIALSDAGAHLSLLCDAGFGLHLMGRFARERGDLSLARAVHEVTGAPAAIYGLRERGRIAPGYWADLLLFDPDAVAQGPKERRRDLPTGAVRLVRQPLGVHGVWVNGTRVIEADGSHRPATPGQVLREFTA